MGIQKPFDMNLADVIGSSQAQVISLYNTGNRQIYVTDRETPFPEGKLIVSVSDLDGNITEANKAFVDMSAYSKEELIGMPHTIIRHPDMPKAAYKDLWDTLAEGKKWHGYVKNLRKDGGYYWTYATIIPNVRQGKLLSYTSVRRKPSKQKVEEHSQLYKEMKSAEI